jgi:putative component of toxin-antitoxin plasmid stabilization module
MNYEVIEYISPDGKNHFAKWFESLASCVAVKIASALHKMRQGNFSNSKALGNGVWEFN